MFSNRSKTTFGPLQGNEPSDKDLEDFAANIIESEDTLCDNGNSISCDVNYEFISVKESLDG